MKTSMANVIANGRTGIPEGYNESKTLSDPNAGKVYRGGRWVSIREHNAAQRVNQR